MAASSTSSWLHTSLLSPSMQQQTAQHTLYAPELAIHQDPQHPGLNSDPRQLCDGFCPPHQCPLNLDFQHSADSHQLPEFNGPAGGSCNGHVGVGDEGGGRISARKIHKADREKLRRDRLNEQFTELAGVLDPDRPKNDKATILGDSVQVVRELRSEVKRLRTEHTSLLDESRDLAQEKIELREEKASLKCDTEHLQSQLQQRIRLMIPWMGMDSAMMMGAPPCGYPIPVAQPASAPPPSDMSHPRQQGSLQESPAATLPSYVPIAPTAPTSYAIHPALQGYTMYANRPADGSVPYLPYPHYPSQITSHSHVERPFPQYPSPIHPVPGYLMQMQPHPGQPPMSGTPSVPTAYQSYPASLSFMPQRAPGTQQSSQTRTGTVHPTAACGSDLSPQLQPQLNQSASAPLQTTLQLQTPLQAQTQQLSQASSKEGIDDTTDAQNGVVETPTSAVEKETQPTPAAARSPSSAVVNSTMVSQLMSGSAGICSPQVSSSKRESVVGHGGKDASADAQKRGPLESHAAAVRPSAA